MPWPPLPPDDPSVVTGTSLEAGGLRVSLKTLASGDFGYLIPTAAPITFATPVTRLEASEAHELLNAYLGGGKVIHARLTFDGPVVTAAHFERR